MDPYKSIEIMTGGAFKMEDGNTYPKVNYTGLKETVDNAELEKRIREAVNSNNALDVQEGGNHYKKCKIQPVQYITENNLSYLQGNVIKYITRYKDKNGKQDLEKAKHYIDLILELEY